VHTRLRDAVVLSALAFVAVALLSACGAPHANGMGARLASGKTARDPARAVSSNATTRRRCPELQAQTKVALAELLARFKGGEHTSQGLVGFCAEGPRGTWHIGVPQVSALPSDGLSDGLSYVLETEIALNFEAR
jgi:hypothetical protein